MKKKYVYGVSSLMVLVVLSGCMSIEERVQRNLGVHPEQLAARVEQYEEMTFDKSIATRFVGTWRRVALEVVEVYSFSADGNIKYALRYFTGNKPDTFMSGSYKASKDTFAQRYYTTVTTGESLASPADSITFCDYLFNDNYSELTYSYVFLGAEITTVLTKIDDKYMDTISDASLNVSRNETQTAVLFFDHMWRQPNEIVKENEYADWTATFRVNTTRINGKDYGLLPAINLPEGVYEIYFDGTITFRRGLDARELPMNKTFRTTLEKGHIYEVKAYIEPLDMVNILRLGPDTVRTLKTAIILTEISWEQYEREYRQQM
jgi:hypothetical protein